MEIKNLSSRRIKGKSHSCRENPQLQKKNYIEKGTGVRGGGEEEKWKK